VLTRRQFSKLLAGSSLLTSSSFARVAGSATLSAPQDMGAALLQSRDLLIKGGTVIEPSQNLLVALGVAVKDGKIQQVAPDIPDIRTEEGRRRLLPDLQSPICFCQPSDGGRLH
jgi:hypothetical protein